MLARSTCSRLKRNGGSNGSGKKNSKFNNLKVRCYNCDDYGNLSKECRKPKKEGNAEAQFAQACAEDEPSLLLLSKEILLGKVRRQQRGGSALGKLCPRWQKFCVLV
jgi:hypothetical protein